jgi:hypothetical protein
VNYATYVHNRDHGILRDTLRDRIGRDLEAEYAERYREEISQWLESPQVQTVCDQIRREA